MNASRARIDAAATAKIGFRFGPLLELNLLAVLQERFFDHARIGKFIGQRPRTIRPFREQVFDHARVSPAEQAVEVAELLVEIVVTLRTDEHDVERDARRLPDHLRQSANSRVGPDPFAVLDSVFQKAVARLRDR